jgi:uncharacterized protein YgbK (DUF1537 family)
MADIGFLADDLTGASDVLAQAHAYGLSAMLVLDSQQPISNEVDVVGIANVARSLSGGEFDEAVRSGLAPLAALPLSVLLYKVCSTFDSSSTVGSIGRGIELLHEAFPDHGAVPVVPAQPAFGRYTAFSQHFGACAGDVYRLDRHPVMSRHPSTPMGEADLRLVLARQLATGQPPAALHLPAYSDGTFDEYWQKLRRADLPAFVVDAVDDDQMDRVAAALTKLRPSTAPALVVGSGGIMAALARTRARPTPRAIEPSSSTGPTLVVSASASATTAAQITDAIQDGWVEIPIPPEALSTARPDATPSGAWVDHVKEALRAGKNVVAHTLRGPNDRRLATAHGISVSQVGGTIGRLAGTMALNGLTRDVVICGGDTSSHALLAVGAHELRVTEQFVTAGPICATDDESDLAGCRLLLKGGQVGQSDLFRRFAGQS